ncbi:MAG TPA: hypothetical protein VKK79_25460, partial [Candidatus Lokiarchaeia archaeon]|nr:hypothetical protein [Candidatus Lokiarchaeia archaeon]
MKTTPRAKSTTANPDQNIARLKEVPEQTREDIDTFLRVISFKTSFVLQPERLLELKLYIARAMAKDRSLRVPLTIEQIELEELQKWPNEIDQQRAQLDEVSRILEQSYIQTGFKQGGYKTKKVGPFFSMGDILHDPVIWSPFNFPPGTLFALREVMQGEKGFPRVPNLSDSSGLLIKPFERLGVTPVSDAFGSRKLHVADVNVATMLEESQVNFLQDPTPAEITPKQVSEWGAAGVTNLAPPAILSNLAQEQADRYWKVPNLGSSTMKQEDKDLIVREFKGSRSNTWESYCQALWKIAEKVMENRARRGDFVAEGKSTDEVLQAIMGEVAFHVKEVGVVPSSQVNLVSAMLYWVKNVTAATNEDPTVNQIYDRNYLRLAYDFIDWCGDHGLYTIENGDGTLADFEDLAASEGLSDSDLADLDDDPLVRNSRIKLYTPYVFPVRLSANTSSIGAPIEKKCERGKGNADEIRITKIRKRILSHRLQEIFDLLHGKSYDSWQIYLWLSSLQTMAAAMQEQNAGFSWLNLDDGQAAAFRRDIIGHASYRYILNYVGGQLVFFKKYLDGELEQYIQPAPLNKDEKWHPLNRWRFYLEIMYVLSLYFSRTILGVYKRADGVIDEVMPALVGMEDTNAIARIVEAINQEPDYQGDVAKNTENSKSAIRAALGAQPPAWYSLLLALFDRRVQQEKRLLENPSARSSSAASGGAPGYFDRLTADLMPFMTKHIRHLFALRFFFRSHFVPFPPDLQDYLPPSLLRADLTTDHLQNLSNSEARSKISRSSLFSGSKVRVLAIEPDEIKTNIQKCMVDPLQFGDSLGELTADVQAILKSNRFRDEFKAMIPRAAKRVEKRRLANTVYKFGIITAMMAQGNGPAAELNCRLDQLKDIGDAYQSQVQESQAVNRNIVTALATFFPTSYLILANFAFGATLPHGGVSIIQGANKEIASYDGDLIKTGTRMFRNLFDSGENEASGKKAGEGGNEGGPERQGEASGEKSQSSEAPNAGSFPYKLGKNMNRSLLRNRMKNWYTTLAAGFRPSAPNPEQVNAGESAPGENLEGTPKYTPELDLLGWAKSKGLLLYFQSEAFITSLAVFETNWGDPPRTVTTALPEDTRQYLKDQSTLYPSLLR